MSLIASGVSLKLGATQALDSVDVRFERGRVTALLGPNGAGKSTLLAVLAALRTPASGSVTIDGVAVAALDRLERARRIGFLPQDAATHWDIDVRALVELGRYPHRGRWGGSHSDSAAVDAALAATGTAAFARRSVATLSGGERSRVLLARVLAGQPEWVLADEPLAHLDPAYQLDMLARLRTLAAAGAGVVVVLHDLGHAARVADDIVLLRQGQVFAAGPLETALTSATIAAAYGIAVHTGCGPDGSRFIVPQSSH